MKKIYLDIETTGLSFDHNEITLIGALVDGEVIQLVNGFDLDDENLTNLFSGITEVVTFNGSSFDLPFIKHKFPNIDYGYPKHTDLMHMSWKSGLKGGLKKIEKELGIDREDDLTGIDAINLWHKYNDEKDLNALETLLEYNRTDVINLVHLEKILSKRLEA